MPARDEQVMVLDRDATVRLWLTEEVEAGRLSQARADGLWASYSENAHDLANYFSVVGDVALMRRLTRDMGFLGQVKYSTYNGRQYIILKGNPRVRQILTGTRYGAQNVKVVSMGLGRAGIGRSAAGGTYVSIFLLTAWNITDYVLRDEATLGDLIGGIAADVTKAAIAGGIGYMAGTAVVAMGATLAIGPLVVAVIVGVAVGMALDALDRRFQLTARLQRMVDRGLARLQAEYERRRDNLIDRAWYALARLTDEVIDLAEDAAIGFARRHLDRLRWRPIPYL